jgi:hypothetical protein
MTPRTRQTFEPVTLGQLRGQGCRDLLIYCNSNWGNHSAKLNPDWLPDDTVLLTLELKWSAPSAG